MVPAGQEPDLLMVSRQASLMPAGATPTSPYTQSPGPSNPLSPQDPPGFKDQDPFPLAQANEGHWAGRTP